MRAWTILTNRRRTLTKNPRQEDDDTVIMEMGRESSDDTDDLGDADKES